MERLSLSLLFSLRVTLESEVGRSFHDANGRRNGWKRATKERICMWSIRFVFSRTVEQRWSKKRVTFRRTFGARGKIGRVKRYNFRKRIFSLKLNERSNLLRLQKLEVNCFSILGNGSDDLFVSLENLKEFKVYQRGVEISDNRRSFTVYYKTLEQNFSLFQWIIIIIVPLFIRNVMTLWMRCNKWRVILSFGMKTELERWDASSNTF